MQQRGRYTRNEAIEIVGPGAMLRCDQTPLQLLEVDYPTDQVEAHCSVRAYRDGKLVTLMAYCYCSREMIGRCGDLSKVDWEYRGYEVC